MLRSKQRATKWQHNQTRFVSSEASEPKLNRKSLFCCCVLGVEAQPPLLPPVQQSQLSLLFPEAPRAWKKKHRFPITTSRARSAESVSSCFFFFKAGLETRTRTHAKTKPCKHNPPPFLRCPETLKNKYICIHRKHRGGWRKWTLTKQHVELAPSLPTVRSLSFD